MQQAIIQIISTNKTTLLVLKNVITWLKYAYTPTSLLIFLYIFWQYRLTLVAIFEIHQIYYILSSAIIITFVQFIFPIAALLTLKSCGILFKYSHLLDIYVKHLPARYLPGGIWHTAGRLVDLHGQGVTPWALTLLTILENSIPASIAFVLGGGSIMHLYGLNNAWGVVALVLLCSSVLFLISSPIILFICTKNIRECKFTFLYYITLITIYIFIWILMSIAFYFYIISFSLTVNNVSFYRIVGVYLFSWSIGFISIFSPQGIGVFEFVVGNLLDYNADTVTLSLLIFGFRALSCSVDMLIYVLCLVFHFIKKCKLVN